MSSAAYEDITAAVERIRVYFGLTIEGDHIKADLDTITSAARDLDREAAAAYGRGRDDEAAEVPTEHVGGGPKDRALCTCPDGFHPVEGPDGEAFCGACGGAAS